MYLKSLEISGFKSFAKKADISFNAPITAIVGPNGSGKSNVAEAFRFVLGEQSMKSMRGRKTEDLIFNGGESSPRANRASVKLVFDNTKRLLNIDFDEVSIERVIHRDSLSEYLINGTQVRLKDVIELLAGAHIGSSGHHMISQGEADRILNANVRERKEMIEDALGLKIYQYKREESERKLEKTRENMDKVESLRKELAPHLKFLKKQVEKVERTIALREELTTLYREYLSRETAYIAETEKEIAQQTARPKAELARLDAELVAAKKVLDEAQHENKKVTELMSLQATLKTAREARDEAVHAIGMIEGELASLERMYAREKSASSAEVVSIEFARVKSLVTRIEELCAELGSVAELGGVRAVASKIRESLA